MLNVYVYVTKYTSNVSILAVVDDVHIRIKPLLLQTDISHETACFMGYIFKIDSYLDIWVPKTQAPFVWCERSSIVSSNQLKDPVVWYHITFMLA